MPRWLQRPVDALFRRKVCFDDLDRNAALLQGLSRLIDTRLIGGDNQIVSFISDHAPVWIELADKPIEK